MNDKERIDFVVGSELRLKDILRDADAGLLLKAVVSAGAGYAAIVDEKKRVLWEEGAADLKAAVGLNAGTIFHEGEPVGYLMVSAPPGRSSEDLIAGIAAISSVCLDLVIKNSVRRMATTELHTAVVRQSYEELLETNERLSLSEKKYRELAEALETRVEERTAELKKAQTRLLEREKMASIGQLAAGIAHEINNPMGFIYSNLNTFGRYIGNIEEMLNYYRSRSGADPEAEKAYEKLKIGFIIGDVGELLKQSIDGAERIRRIVANLKGFSHIDEIADRGMDINEELDRTLSVLASEIRSRSAEVVRDYGGLPFFHGNPGLICQAFLNIIMNALQSRDKNPRIGLRTFAQGESIVVVVEDNGAGIPPEILGRIFEPFFTTREVGKGIGMGLAVAYDIMSSYSGSIEAKSEPGKGSVFVITLPVKGRT